MESIFQVRISGSLFQIDERGQLWHRGELISKNDQDPVDLCPLEKLRGLNGETIEKYACGSHVIRRVTTQLNEVFWDVQCRCAWCAAGGGQRSSNRRVNDR